MINDVTIIPATSTTRKVTFRIDNAGVYFLFWQEEILAAGVSFQWPQFITKNPHLKPGFTVFSYDFEREYAREHAKVIVKLEDGFIAYNPNHIFTFELLYDAEGVYVGQNQDDAYDGGILFLGAEISDNGDRCVNGTPIAPLTSEEMASAVEENWRKVDTIQAMRNPPRVDLDDYPSLYRGY